MASGFSSIPLLDYELSKSPSTKAKFLADLQYAVSHVGFLYLANPPVPAISELLPYIPRIFDLPQEAKDRITMRNSPHFLGYSRLGAELTRGETDQREQFDFATPHVCRWKEGDPDYYRLWGPSQWPDEALISGFGAVMERYLLQVQELSYQFVDLLEEAFYLAPGTLKSFYDAPELMQHRGKLVKYPDDVPTDQGVGPHYDAGFLTFLHTIAAYRFKTLLVNGSTHRLSRTRLLSTSAKVPLSMLNCVKSQLISLINVALEFVTQGLARATSHRVLSPSKGSGPRYSVPLFQNIGLHVRLADKIVHFPPEIESLRAVRGNVVKTESVNFTEFDREPSGHVNLIGRVKSHPDVAQIHYPALFKEIFPNGWKEGMKGSAY